MKNWRPIVVLLAVVVLAHYGFLLVRSMREWNLQRENQLLRQELLAVSSLQRDLASLRELSRKLDVHLGPAPGLKVGQGSTPTAPHLDIPAASAPVLPLSMPVAGRLSRLFERAGWPERLDHAGLDLATEPGDLVYAAAAGHVVFRDLTQRLGFMVLIDHGGGLTTGYGHLAMAYPEIGERVARGQVIGRVARGGVGRGSHLHFSTQRGGIPVDPAPLLGGWQEKEREDS
jgi:murein DD-endopeptidase MepM/ murein hydrolase activator NlpD